MVARIIQRERERRTEGIAKWPVSLNLQARRSDMKRIINENQVLLRKISQVRSQYGKDALKKHQKLYDHARELRKKDVSLSVMIQNTRLEVLESELFKRKQPETTKGHQSSVGWQDKLQSSMSQYSPRTRGVEA